MPETRRTQLNTLRAAMLNERSSFISHWKDLANYILVRRAQFQVTDTNRGDRKNQKIVNSTATLASRTLRSGMMSGVTSPARPWFRLSTPDPALAEIGSVKVWLHTVTQGMNTVFLKSNLYNALPILYGDMGTFATGAMLIEEDFEDVVRFYPFPIGSYAIALNDKGKVAVFLREFRLTVRQLIAKFGYPDGKTNIVWDNISHTVKSYYDKAQYDTWIDVTHVIQLNEKYNPDALTSKQYESIYFETGQAGTAEVKEEKYLRDRGYSYFPVLAPRWEVTGEDVYGTECPGMSALGDIKALQVSEKRKAQAIEKMVNPPMVGPTSLRSGRPTILPGDITYDDERAGTKGFRAAHEVNIQLKDHLDDIAKNEQRIKKAYFEDLFRLLEAMEGVQPRNELEILERKSEKLMALSPVLEQLNQDLLDPLIDITFNIMVRQGLIPPPPEELSGQDLKVEYISIMHQAQKLAGLAGIERLTRFTAEIAGFDPDIIDKLDTDQVIDEYAEIIGAPPTVVVSDELVAETRQARAEEVAREKQAEQMKNAAGAVKDLGDTSLEGESALGALVQQSRAGAI